MRCSTIEVIRDGQKVTINLSDFDPKTMIKWDDKIKPEFVVNSPVTPPPSSRRTKFPRK